MSYPLPSESFQLKEQFLGLWVLHRLTLHLDPDWGRVKRIVGWCNWIRPLLMRWSCLTWTEDIDRFSKWWDSVPWIFYGNGVGSGWLKGKTSSLYPTVVIFKTLTKITRKFKLLEVRTSCVRKSPGQSTWCGEVWVLYTRSIVCVVEGLEGKNRVKVVVW